MSLVVMMVAVVLCVSVVRDARAALPLALWSTTVLTLWYVGCFAGQATQRGRQYGEATMNPVVQLSTSPGPLGGQSAKRWQALEACTPMKLVTTATTTAATAAM